MHRPDPLYKHVAAHSLVEWRTRDDLSTIPFVATGKKTRSTKRKDVAAPATRANGASPLDTACHGEWFALSNMCISLSTSGIVTTRGASDTIAVMDPIAVLRECIRYICSRPEVYGDNIRSLLEYEVMYVMRVKASEMALGGPQPVLYGPDSGDAPTALQQESCSLPPLVNSTHTLACPQQCGSRAASRRRGKDCATQAKRQQDGDGFLGFGGLSLAPSNTGFMALMDKNAVHGKSTPIGTGLLPENITWSSATNEGNCTYRDAGALPLPEKASLYQRTIKSVATSDGETSPDTNTCSPTPQVVVDGAGYELSFLRGQLQQVEAAYNSKCTRLHELVAENSHLQSQLAQTKGMADKRLEAYNAIHSQLETTRRELDAWKERAAEVSASTPTHDAQRSMQNFRLQSVHMAAMRDELSKLTQLWRETERALQESRRALENVEKEADQTHDHLSDAFQYIERLERRVARRDAHIDLAGRRQTSLETKYEKLMWCFQELGTMRGIHSYADCLLAESPVWSLYLFVRLHRHVGDFLPITEESSDALQGGHLCFKRSPGGGRYSEDSYEPRLIHSFIVSRVSRVGESEGRPRLLLTNLHGAVGCKVLRWNNLFSIDFLGGEGNDVDSTNLILRSLPVLTLASLLLPLRPAWEAVGMTSAAAAIQESNSDTEAVELDAAVPVTASYNQATIGFLLRCFWKARLEDFLNNMKRRKAFSVRILERRRARHEGTNASASRSGSYGGDTATDDGLNPFGDEVDEEHRFNTFLGALVAFLDRVLQSPSWMGNPLHKHAPTATGGAGCSPGGHDGGDAASHGNGGEPAPLFAVRGVRRQGDKNSHLWVNGRLFFASVLTGKLGSTDTCETDEAFSSFAFTPALRELLCALYYYTMEYKDSDADFRLFYLVSHQLIPEVVGINFFASIDAFEHDCYKRLTELLSSSPVSDGAQRPLDETSQTRFPGENTATTKGTADDDAQNYVTSTSRYQADNPLSAIKKVAALIDTTPLVAEDETMDAESDGDGFGSILAGQKPTNTTGRTVKARSQSVSGGTGAQGAYRYRASEKRISDSCSNTSARSANSTGDRAALHMATADKDKSLLFNIRNYLEELQHRQQRWKKDNSDGLSLKCTSTKDGESLPNQKEFLPSAWDDIDGTVSTLLAPHQSFLNHYHLLQSQSASQQLKAQSFFAEQRQARAHFDANEVPRYAAARGLLSIDDVLMLFRKHCFAAYGVACCGTPRLSLYDTLCSTSFHSLSEYLQPFSILGQLPPTSMHLRRLRFALALDQPSSLIQFTRLFDFDSHTSSVSHFYDEYLTLTLDIYQQQQRYFMDSLLAACAARHSRYASEGAEECDGNISISYLKKGFLKTYTGFSLGKDEAYAFVDHLTHYDQLLRHEEDVQREQFHDAIFLINSSRTDESAGMIRTEDEWHLEEEAQTCSLVHLSLALRLTYFVWGHNATNAAMRLMQDLSIIDIHTPHSVPCGPKANGLGSVFDHSQVGSLPCHTDRAFDSCMASERRRVEEAAFEDYVKHSYAIACSTLSSGHSARVNPLREAKRVMDEEAKVTDMRAITQAAMRTDSQSKEDAVALYPTYADIMRLLAPQTRVGTSNEKQLKSTKGTKTSGAKTIGPAERRPPAPIACVPHEMPSRPVSCDSSLASWSRMLGLLPAVPVVSSLAQRKAKKARLLPRERKHDANALSPLQALCHQCSWTATEQLYGSFVSLVNVAKHVADLSAKMPPVRCMSPHGSRGGSRTKRNSSPHGTHALRKHVETEEGTSSAKVAEGLRDASGGGQTAHRSPSTQRSLHSLHKSDSSIPCSGMGLGTATTVDAGDPEILSSMPVMYVSVLHPGCAALSLL